MTRRPGRATGRACRPIDRLDIGGRLRPRRRDPGRGYNGSILLRTLAHAKNRQLQQSPFGIDALYNDVVVSADGKPGSVGENDFDKVSLGVNLTYTSLSISCLRTSTYLSATL